MLISFSFARIHLVNVINVLPALLKRLHIGDEVRLVALKIVEEVFNGAEGHRPPRVLFTEVDWLLDGLLIKIGVLLLDLIYEVLFKHGIYLVISPSEILAPKNQCVDIVIADPARLMVLVLHPPLPAARDIDFVTELTLKN